MVDILTSISTSIDLVRKLRDINEKISNVDFKGLLADLQSELVDAKLEVVALKEKTAELLTKNAELTQKLEARTSEQPEPMSGGYKFGDKGPYCIACFEKSGKKILLPRSSGIHAHFGQWFCQVCHSHS